MFDKFIDVSNTDLHSKIDVLRYILSASSWTTIASRLIPAGVNTLVFVHCVLSSSLKPNILIVDAYQVEYLIMQSAVVDCHIAYPQLFVLFDQSGNAESAVTDLER